MKIAQNGLFLLIFVLKHHIMFKHKSLKIKNISKFYEDHMAGNDNHPPKGSILKVEPLRSIKDIHNIRNHLKSKPRDLAIFDFGINSNLRAVDLVNLKVKQVRNLRPGDSLELREIKTKKKRSLILNRVGFRSIQNLLNSNSMINAKGDDYLFQSRKGKRRLRPNTLNALVKKWTKAIGLTARYGSHSLRKTFGYQHRTQFGTDIPTLMTIFNHSTQKQTLDYLCVHSTEVKNAYLKEI